MIRVAHVITSTDTGGAESMLYKLLDRTDRAVFESSVVSLRRPGAVGERIRSLGIEVSSLEMQAFSPGALFKLASMLKHRRPDIVQTWLYHADLLGGAACKLAGNALLVWNIRHAKLDPDSEKRSTIRLGKLNGLLSGSLPDRIICCAEAARRDHAHMGYAASKFVVIPNGFDTDAFAPSPQLRVEMRRELDIPADALVIGHVGRFHPVKDHHGFVAAAALLSAEFSKAIYVMCGDGVDWSNDGLAGWIRAATEESKFRLLGRRSDISRITSTFDIATSCSTSEGFSNVIGEAMACGVPCVVTDVGDSALIVGDCGKVVPPSNSAELYEAWRYLLALQPAARQELGELARRRIIEQFSIERAVGMYEGIYRSLLEPCAA